MLEQDGRGREARDRIVAAFQGRLPARACASAWRSSAQYVWPLSASHTVCAGEIPAAKRQRIMNESAFTVITL